MTSTVRVSILLLYLIEKIVLTVSTFPTTVSEDERHAKLLVYGKLQSLRNDIGHFIATYSRPLGATIGQVTSYSKRKNPPTGWTKVTRSTFKRYYMTKRKYPRVNDRLEYIYNYFVNVFSLHNETIRRELLSFNAEKLTKTKCYLEVHSTFMRHCYYEYYVHTGLKEIKVLLTRVCLVDWLSVNKINYVLQSVCQRRFRFKIFNLHKLS